MREPDIEINENKENIKPDIELGEIKQRQKKTLNKIKRTISKKIKISKKNLCGKISYQS